jgi:hypothetical protein
MRATARGSRLRRLLVPEGLLDEEEMETLFTAGWSPSPLGDRLTTATLAMVRSLTSPNSVG